MTKEAAKEVVRSKKGDFEPLSVNPFMTGVKVQTKKRMLTVARGSKLTDVDTGEEELTTTVAQVKLVEKEQFVKVFSSQIKLYFDLSAPGFKVFMLVLQAVQEKQGVDRISLSFVQAQKAAVAMGQNLSRSVFDRGIVDLYEKRILWPSDERDWHFVNPAVCFNGDRARFVTEFRKASADQLRQQSLPGFDMDQTPGSPEEF